MECIWQDIYYNDKKKKEQCFRNNILYIVHYIHILKYYDEYLIQLFGIETKKFYDTVFSYRFDIIHCIFLFSM